MESQVEEKLEKLEDPELFYNISQISYSSDISDYDGRDPDNISDNNILKRFDFSTASTYEPVFCFLKDIYESSPSAKKFSSILYTVDGEIKNLTAFREKPVNKSCIILVHGFKSRNKGIYIQLGKRFARNKIDGLVYTLPFHFERKFSDREGNDVLDLKDFRATLEFFRQTVAELRILVRELKKIGYSSVGLLGFSFGGYCCSLLACFDRNVDFIVPMASMGSFGDLLKFKKGKANLDPNDERDRINDFFSTNYLKLICPINYKPVIDPENILFIQGLFDIRAPYRDVAKLRQKWGNPDVVWFPCDHATFFLFNHLTLMLTIRFLKRHGFVA